MPGIPSREGADRGLPRRVSASRLKPGPNDPCPCGSGKKHKECCGSISAPRTLKSPASALDVQAAVRLATQYHQAGQLEHAESVYRQILAVRRNDPNALHLLGLLAHQSGKHRVAADRDFHAQMAAARKESGVIFEDVETVRELESFFENALKAARRGDFIDVAGKSVATG